MNNKEGATFSWHPLFPPWRSPHRGDACLFYFCVFVCAYSYKYVIMRFPARKPIFLGVRVCQVIYYLPRFSGAAQTCRQACVLVNYGYVPSDRSSHSSGDERDCGREVGTLSYAWGEGAKACYPYRMLDYCSLLGFQETGGVLLPSAPGNGIPRFPYCRFWRTVTCVRHPAPGTSGWVAVLPNTFHGSWKPHTEGMAFASPMQNCSKKLWIH